MPRDHAERCVTSCRVFMWSHVVAPCHDMRCPAQAVSRMGKVGQGRVEGRVRHYVCRVIMWRYVVVRFHDKTRRAQAVPQMGRVGQGRAG